MDNEQFFSLLVKETEINTELRKMYRFVKDRKNFLFRKSYYCQRLEYVRKNITDKYASIWDCGCGYGTTGIFLALNGFKVYGTTVEYYYSHIHQRFEYWKQFGDVSGFTVDYQNIFDPPFFNNQFDYVITQDVLHHLEPNHEALQIIKNSMKQSGKLVVCEENGNNIINNFKLFLRRGNRKIIDIYDEKLNKIIKLGNENIQSLASWKSKFNHSGMAINAGSVEYIRLLPPFCFTEANYNRVIEREYKIWKKSRIMKECLFFGVNFTVSKT